VSAEERFCPAADLQAGDRIEWCGRVLTLDRVDAVPPRQLRSSRWGVYVTAAVDGKPTRLHYWATERVPVAP
jgi:hypothetical protein